MSKIKGYIKNPFLVSFFFLLLSVAFLLIFFNKISRDSIVDQVLYRKQVIARAGAKSIESLFKIIGKSTALLSDNPTKDNFNNFIDTWEDDDVVGVVAINKEGLVYISSNIQGDGETGADLSDRNYYIWSKTAKKGEYKVFEPILSKGGITRGKYVITIVSPIIKNDKFDGAVVSAIQLSDFASTYINNLKLLSSSKLYIVTSEGNIVYSDDEEFLGKNFMDIFTMDFIGKKTVLSVISSELKKDNETTIRLAIPNFQNGFKLEPYIIAAAPINMNGVMWKVIISVPEKDLLVYSFNLLNKQLLATFIVVTIFIALTLRVSRNIGYTQAVEDEHKKHHIE